MSDTQQLEPPARALPPALGLPQRLPWWRRIGAGVLGVSLLVHLLFALLAGYLIVQHFQPKPEPRQPPRGTLLPREPKILVQQRSQNTAVRKVTTVNPLADLVLPEVTDPVPGPEVPLAPPGALAGGIQSPALELARTNRNPYGDPGIADGLAGRFYDLKQDRSRRPTDMNMGGYAEVVKKYVEGGWQDRDLARFYSSAATLGLYQFFIPNLDAAQGPAAFRMEKKVAPTMWLAHYRAQVIAPETGRYHFVGAGDDVMLVGFGGRLVLDRCWNLRLKPAESNYRYGYTGIPEGFARGEAMDVVKGQSYPLDVLIGEQPGGKMFAFLLLEKEGESYAQDAHGNPILPVFRVKNVPLPAVAAGTDLPPHQAAIPAWSVWRVAPPKR